MTTPAAGDPERILDFWFGDAARDPAAAEQRSRLWFGGDERTDVQIRTRFGADVEAAVRGERDVWLGAPRSALALVVLLDQFPRNLWRGTPRAFACDAQALAAAQRGVASGHLAALAPIEGMFLLLPYEHSESLAVQRESVLLHEQVAASAPPAWQPVLQTFVDYARRHHAVIERFGRFPHRNEVLGRTPTEEEQAYLRGGGEDFGRVALERERWEDAWKALGAAAPAGLLDELAACYAEPHRAYHTLQHLRECFEALEPVAGLAAHLPEVQLALWFHDAIYDTRAQDNEERSATWAAASLERAGIANDVAARVHALVMVTRHAAIPTGADAELLVDVDLSILGAPEARFAEYERQVRREYAWVPEEDFRKARARVLTSFLARPRIYSTEWFASRLEERARANLARSIAELSR